MSPKRWLFIHRRQTMTKAQNTLKPRDHLWYRFLTDVIFKIGHHLVKYRRPLRNGAINGRAASVYFGLKAENTLRPCVRLSRPFNVFAVDLFILVIRFSVYTED